MWHGKKEFVRARKIDLKKRQKSALHDKRRFFAKRRFNDVDGAMTATTMTITTTATTMTATTLATTTMTTTTTTKRQRR